MTLCAYAHRVRTHAGTHTTLQQFSVVTAVVLIVDETGKHKIGRKCGRRNRLNANKWNENEMNEWKRNDDKIAEWQKWARDRGRGTTIWQNCQQPVVRFIVKWRHTSHCASLFTHNVGDVLAKAPVWARIKCATVAFIVYVRVRAFRAHSLPHWHKRKKNT